ncbi:hypothetical protein QUF80_10380 [Desulfococcaceae bacterium HSG8]|nr:hypothetical protein [Desulfococcaceae bacterium HSG8]
MRFVVPPSGGLTPPEGGTTNFDLVCFLLEITFVLVIHIYRGRGNFGFFGNLGHGTGNKGSLFTKIRIIRDTSRKV